MPLFILVVLLLLLLLLVVQRRSGFPKILYQTWKSKLVIPPRFHYWRQTWLHHHPQWKHFFWDDTDNRDFIRLNFPWFLKRYDAYDMNIKRVDSVRYFFLYNFGGVYADLDFESLRPLDLLLDQYASRCDVLLGRMQHNPENAWHVANSIPNALMASKPGSVFWIWVFMKLLDAPFHQKAEVETGPVFLRECLRSWPTSLTKVKEFASVRGLVPNFNSSRVCFLEPSVWYPIAWPISTTLDPNLERRTRFVKTRFPASYAATYWTGTWKKSDG